MSRKSERRSVKPETLDHQERGLVLETRPVTTEPGPDAAPAPGGELRERLRAAKRATPAPGSVHALVSYRLGWIGALVAVDAPPEEIASRLSDAKSARPTEDTECLDCYRRGWRAAVRAIEGE